jgi:hypothetical protein
VKSALALPDSARADRYGELMRRHLVLAAALTGVLAVSACSSDTGTRRTVTAVVTVSSGDAAASGSEQPAASESAPPTDSASPSPESSAAA